MAPFKKKVKIQKKWFLFVQQSIHTKKKGVLDLRLKTAQTGFRVFPKHSLPPGGNLVPLSQSKGTALTI